MNEQDGGEQEKVMKNRMQSIKTLKIREKRDQVSDSYDKGKKDPVYV